MVSLDGNVFFPPQFASQEHLDQLDKRRLSGIRRRSSITKKKSSTGSSVGKLARGLSGQGSPEKNLVATLTENQGEESQFG